MNIDSTPPLKILVLGAQDTGKSALITRFVDGTFSKDKLNFVGWTFTVKKINTEQQTFRLQIWDMGKETNVPQTKVAFRECHSLILTFSSSEQGSIERAEELFSSLHQNGPPDASVILVETKTDLNSSQQLGAHLLERLSKKCNAVRLFRCSAKTGDGVEKLFQQVATEAYESYLLSIEGKVARPVRAPHKETCSIL